MVIEIKEEVFAQQLKQQVNTAAQRVASNYVKSVDVQHMARDLFMRKFDNECKKMLNSGTLYDVLARHIAQSIAPECWKKVYCNIDIKAVEEKVADMVADKIADKLLNKILENGKKNI